MLFCLEEMTLIKNCWHSVTLLTYLFPQIQDFLDYICTDAQHNIPGKFTVILGHSGTQKRKENYLQIHLYDYDAKIQ